MINVSTYKNYDELEESLTMDELYALISKIRESNHDNRKFLAAMQGIDIGEAAENEKDAKAKFEEIQERANAKLNGATDEEAEFAGMGIGVEVVDF